MYCSSDHCAYFFLYPSLSVKPICNSCLLGRGFTTEWRSEWSHAIISFQETMTWMSLELHLSIEITLTSNQYWCNFVCFPPNWRQVMVNEPVPGWSINLFWTRIIGDRTPTDIRHWHLYFYSQIVIPTIWALCTWKDVRRSGGISVLALPGQKSLNSCPDQTFLFCGPFFILSLGAVD